MQLILLMNGPTSEDNAGLEFNKVHSHKKDKSKKSPTCFFCFRYLGECIGFLFIFYLNIAESTAKENDVNESNATFRNTLSRKKMIYIRTYGKWHYLHLLFVEWDEKERTQYPFLHKRPK